MNTKRMMSNREWAKILKDFDARMETKGQKHISKAMLKADRELEKEIKDVERAYKHLDFRTPDENGKSIEYKVLEHAQAWGIPSFKVAFKDWYHSYYRQYWPVWYCEENNDLKMFSEEEPYRLGTYIYERPSKKEWYKYVCIGRI